MLWVYGRYKPKYIIILPARGSSLDIRIWRLSDSDVYRRSPELKGLMVDHDIANINPALF